MLKSVVRTTSVLLLVLVAACGGEKKAETPTKLVAPTEAEARAFGEQFVQAVSSGDIVGGSAMIDWDILLERATLNAGGSSKFRSDFIKGAKGTTTRSALIQQLSGAVTSGGRMKMMRVRGDDEARSVLFRILLPNGSVTYNEMLLTKDSAGKVRAADVHAYATGEYVSAAMRRMYVYAVASEPTFMERLAKKKHPALIMAEMYKEMSEKSLAGDHQGVVAVYKRMPPELRKEKNIMVAYVSASANLPDDQYQKALDELRAAFPNDAGIDLMLIDGFYMKKRYDDALAAIDRLDKDLGGDPYLDKLRAGVLTEKGDFDSARRYAQRAVDREPELAD